MTKKPRRTPSVPNSYTEYLLLSDEDKMLLFRADMNRKKLAAMKSTRKETR